MAIERLAGPNWDILICDVMEGLTEIPDQSVHCCVTSPPYWGLRNYGFDGQIGLEKTPGEFIERLVGVFREVKRILRNDGVLWVNLGDSYCKDSKYGGQSGSKHEYYADQSPRDQSRTCLPNGNMVGIPWRVALALQADGWILRSCVIWNKKNPMPESVSGWRWVKCRIKVAPKWHKDNPHPSVAIPGGRNSVGNHSGYSSEAARWKDCPGCDKCRDTNGLILRKGNWRPTTSHEYVFMFVKSGSYFSDGDGSKEKCSGTAHHRGSGVHPKSASKHESKQNHSYSSQIVDVVETRNQRSVMTLSSEGFKEDHFATFPSELVRRCLISSTSRGGCCSACGAQYAPVVESKRSATRPGTNSKTTSFQDRCGSRLENPEWPNIVGNRDPQRHTTTMVVTGYLPTCKCNAPMERPTVCDVFGGSMTTGQVAINMGCRFIGIEGSPEYAAIGKRRLETPWTPKSERQKNGKKPVGSVAGQLSLFE